MENIKATDIKHLVNLLNLEDDVYSDDDSDSGEKKNPYSQTFTKTPATCVDEKIIKNTEKPNYYKKTSSSKNIWSDDEILCEDFDEAHMKEKPFYEMIYQQKVTPDDIFLQLDGKGPGTDSCECLLVKIKLNGTNSKDDILLNTSTLSLVCKTEKYYLEVDFPKRVDPSKCLSTWDQSDSLLTVQLFFDEKIWLQK